MLRKGPVPASRLHWPLLLVTLQLGCIDSPEVDVPPDMTDLRAAYQAPTAELTDGEAQAAVQDLLTQSSSSRQALTQSDFTLELVEQLDEAVVDTDGITLGNLELALEGSGRILHTCLQESAGHRGSSELRFTFMQGGLGPELWGELSECTLDLDRRERTRTFYDGDFRAYLMDQEGFTPVGSHYLLEFDGRIQAEGLPAHEGRFDLEFDDGTVTTRIPLSDGSWFWLRTVAGSDRVDIEDTQGTFNCSLTQRQCTSDDHPLGDFSF